MRLLIFGGDASEIAALGRAIPNATCLTVETPGADRTRILAEFKRDPGAVLVTGAHMSSGWRAPDETVVLFGSNWTEYYGDGPHTQQARARVSTEGSVGAA